jgi:hypothetical protein
MAVALGHSIPDATLRVRTSVGDAFLASSHHPSALMTCCQLRAAIVTPRHIGVPHVRDVLVDVELVGGAIDLGGGLYQRAHPSTPDQRWFATTLDQDAVVALAECHTFDMPDDAIGVVLRPDVDLGATVVTMTAQPGHGFRLDEVSFWLLAACMSNELTNTLPAGPSAAR